MDATKLLKKDHERVRKLFARIAGEEDAAKRRELFEEIRTELTIHSEIEEAIFYPEVRMTQVDEAEEEVLEALEEHQGVKVLLDEIARIGADAPQFATRIEELRTRVEGHVVEEEGEMFPEAIDLLGAERLDRIGKAMQERKDALKAVHAR